MKIKLILLSIINMIRMITIKLLSFGRIESTFIQFISLGTELKAETFGRIKIKGRIHTEKNVLLSSKNGLLSIGDKVYINRNTMIVCREKIEIGDGTTIGPNVNIFDHDHNMIKKGEILSSPIIIGKNVWIGAGSIILKGVYLGDGAVVAAGTIVTKNIPPHTLVYNELRMKNRKIKNE